MAFNPATRTPGVVQTASLVKAGGLSDLPTIVALVGYRATAGGSMGATLDNTPTEITSREQVTEYFGRSQLDLMVRDAFETGDLARRGDPVGAMPAVFVVPLAPPGATTAATYTATFTGPATAAGRITADILDQTVIVLVEDGDTDAEIAAKLDAEILTVENELPLTASSALAVTTLTARELGEWGNDVFFDLDVSEAPGVAVVVAAGAVGAGVVALTTALDNLLDVQFVDSVTIGQSDAASRAALKSHILDGWDFATDRPRVGIFAVPGDSGAAVTEASLLDDWRIMVPNPEKLGSAPFSTTSGRSMAAVMGASVAVRLSSRPDRPNGNHNQKRIAGYAAEGLPARLVSDNTLDGGVTPLVNGGDARILRPISSAINDQTINAGPSPTPDLRWQPIEIAYVVIALWRQVRVILDKYTQEDVTSDIAQRAKLEVLALLRAAAASQWIMPVSDDAVFVKVVDMGGSNQLTAALQYSVLVNIDVVAIEHKVVR